MGPAQYAFDYPLRGWLGFICQKIVDDFKIVQGFIRPDYLCFLHCWNFALKYFSTSCCECTFPFRISFSDCSNFDCSSSLVLGIRCSYKSFTEPFRRVSIRCISLSSCRRANHSINSIFFSAMSMTLNLFSKLMYSGFVFNLILYLIGWDLIRPLTLQGA